MQPSGRRAVFQLERQVRPRAPAGGVPMIRRGTRSARWLRYAWASPPTALGLALALLGLRKGSLSVVEGVVEAHGPILRWALQHLVPIPGGAAAITLGHVVLGTDGHALACTRRHERVHVRQYERWGPLFPMAYVAACVYAVSSGGHAYYDNHFETEAWRDQ